MLIVAAALLCIAGAGCSHEPSTAPSSSSSGEVNPGGDIPDNQAFVPYTDPGGVFVVSVPEGWSRTTSGTDTVFTDKLNSIRIGTAPRPAAPTVTGVHLTEMPQLAAATPGFQLTAVSTVELPAGPAVLIAYTAQSPTNPVTGKTGTDDVARYEFWNNGHQVVLTLSSPQGADNADPWRTVVNSLQWR